MSGTYTLELEVFSLNSASVSNFEIWEDGVLDSTHTISSSGSTILVTINYGGALPASLEFRFSGGVGESVEVRTVKIDDRYVNTNNYLSNDVIAHTGNATVDVVTADFLFDDSDPAGATFTTGATQTFTAGSDFHRDPSGTTDEVFDMLAGRDVAYLGSGDDTVSGGADNDTLRGGAGNDLLFGDTGDDRLYGEAGNDTLYGGDGNDRVHGGAGNDEIYGGIGNDALNGHDGDDIIIGGDGADRLNGGADDDYLFGDIGDDILTGAAGADTLDGGAGADLAFGGAGNDIINGGDNNDTLLGNAGADTISGDDGDDTIFLRGSDFAVGEAIHGGVGTDELILSGAMTVDFTTGVLSTLETLTGASGVGVIDYDHDVTYTIQQALDFTTIDLGDGTDNSRIQINGIVDATVLGIPTVTNAENGFLEGTTGADDLTITGAQLDTLIYGTGTIDFDMGTDVIHLTSTSADLNVLGGTDGSVTGLEEIDASSAAASVTIDMNAQSEDFILTGGGSADTITSGSGDDTVTGGAGDDILAGGTGADTIDGGTNNDTIYAAIGSSSDIINVNFDTSADGFVYADDVFLGTAQPAYASGVRITTDGNTANGALEVTLGGVDNADFGPISGAWQETFNLTTAMANVSISFAYRALNSGGQPFETGEDLFLYATLDGDFLSNTANDYFDSQLDPDAGYNSGWQTITVNLGGLDAGNHTLSLGGLVTFKTQVGEEIDIRYDDVVITGISADDSAAVNVLDGGAGDDTIYGGDGADTIDSGADDDIVYGFEGADTIEGGLGNDTIYGGDGGDDVYASTVADHTAATAVGDTGVTNHYSANFDASVEGWAYQDGFFGGAANNAYASGTRITTDGDAGNGSLEISLGGIDGADVGPISGAWEERINLSGAQTDVILSFSYRVLDAVQDGDPWDAGEDLELYVDVDGTQYGTDGNNYFFQLLAADSDASYDSGWQRVSINIGSVTAGNHFWRIGGELSFKTFASEEYDIRIDDVSIDSIVGGTATGTTNIVSGGDGLDTLYGSTETDIFTFDSSAFNNIDVIEKFDFSELDALDISEILTGFDGNITDFVQFTDSGANTLVQVDANGTTGGTSFTTIAQINGLTGLDEQAFYTSGNIIA